MDLYTKTSFELSKQLTQRYSTSFSASSRLFDISIRKYIYAIYGLVRIADEIVDSYSGSDAKQQLNDLEKETYRAIKKQYSPNPIVHAYAMTSQKFAIDQSLLASFFSSMRTDLTAKKFDEKSYATYIYGSAEVIGLMCLSVFTQDASEYSSLAHGAKKLGSAYQKINFLRDLKSDHEELGRIYFPGLNYASFNETDKLAVIKDIRSDLTDASSYIVNLPKNSRRAVRLSYRYYSKLLIKLEQTPAELLKKQRARVTNLNKLYLFGLARLGL